nr:hypothetical protein CFP56_04300 [Quercus suber]
MFGSALPRLTEHARAMVRRPGSLLACQQSAMRHLGRGPWPEQDSARCRPSRPGTCSSLFGWAQQEEDGVPGPALPCHGRQVKRASQLFHGRSLCWRPTSILLDAGRCWPTCWLTGGPVRRAGMPASFLLCLSHLPVIASPTLTPTLALAFPFPRPPSLPLSCLQSLWSPRHWHGHHATAHPPARISSVNTTAAPLAVQHLSRVCCGIAPPDLVQHHVSHDQITDE